MDITKKLITEILKAKGSVDTDYAIQRFRNIKISSGYDKEKVDSIIKKVMQTKNEILN